MTDSLDSESISPDQLSIARQLLESESYGTKAIAILEQQGNYADAFYELWTEKNGPLPMMGDRPSLWQITLKRVRQEICGEDDSFRSKLKDYKKSPMSAPLLTGLIVSLVGMSGLPIDPAIATVIVLYVLHVGLDVFCEYTAPAKDASAKDALPPGDSP